MSDQITYARWLVATAHGLGLGIGLKNGLGMLPNLTTDFEFFGEFTAAAVFWLPLNKGLAVAGHAARSHR